MKDICMDVCYTINSPLFYNTTCTFQFHQIHSTFNGDIYLHCSYKRFITSLYTYQLVSTMARVMKFIVVQYVLILTFAICQSPDETSWNPPFQEQWIVDLGRSAEIPISVELLEQTEVQSWFRFYYPNHARPNRVSKFFCPYCMRYRDKFNTQPPAVSQYYMHFNVKENNRKIREHFSSVTHQRALEFYKQEFHPAPGQELDKDGVSLATINMFKLVYIEVKTNIPTESHRILTHLLHEIGANIGKVFVDMRDFNLMMEFISDRFHNQLINRLTHNFASHIPLSLILDGSKDNTGRHFMSISIVTLHLNQPVTYFYRIINYSDDLSARGIVTKVVEALRKDMIYDIVKIDLKGVGTDGAAVMLSQNKGFIGLIRTEFERGNIYSVWCTSHRMQLVVGHGMDATPEIAEFMGLLKQFNNNLFSMYKQTRRHQHLVDTAKRLGESVPRIHQIHDVRWMETEFLAYNSLSTNYRVIVEELKSFRTILSQDSVAFPRVTGYLGKLEDPEFILKLHMIVELLSEFTKYSLRSQTLEQSLIDIMDFRDEIYRYLDWTTEFEKFDAFKNTIMNGDIPVFRQPWTDLSKLQLTWKGFNFPLTNEMYTEFERWIETVCKSLRVSLEKYFPSDKYEDFMVFHPKKLPDSVANIKNYGAPQVQKLNRFFRIHANSNQVVSEWNDLLKQMIEDPTYKDLKMGIVHNFWSHFVTKIERDDGKTNIYKLIRILLVIPSGTSEVERSFSSMNNIVSLRRGQTSDVHVQDRLRITLNGGFELEKLPFDSWAKLWTLNHNPADLETFRKNTAKRTKFRDTLFDPTV